MTDLTTAERRVLRQLVTGMDIHEIGVPNDEAGNERRAGSSDRASAKGASLKRTRIHLGALAVGAVLLLAVASACAGHSTTPTATLTTTAITTAVGISTTTEATPTVLAQSAAPVTRSAT
jgi:hypothetical protein